MIVVADTSPLNYLIQINCDHLLPKVFGSVLVPDGVILELNHPRTPTIVHAWLKQIPSWIDVCSTTSHPSIDLMFLDLGEREAIQLAEERAAHLLLIDERKGRLEAKRRGLKTTGTLGVLLSGGELGLIDPASTYRQLLLKTSFRVSAALEEEFLSRFE